MMDKMELADPTIFLYEDIYYVYGTGGRGGDVDRGFLVYSSPDLRKWDGPRGAKQGYSLTREDAFGDWGFWAPQLFQYRGAIYMAYTTNENIAIAKSQSPLGPFVEHAHLSGPTRQIDPFVFIDDDGKIYIYYVRLSGGNKIYVAELNDDLTAIVPGTGLLCIEATDVWEDTQQISWKVAEGPTLIKKDGKYYLFYSANHFENRDYAAGYAVSDSPLGPWKKSNQNPILSWGLVGIHGTGHGDFFQDTNNEYYYVFHTHFDNTRVQPRLTALMKGEFSELNPQGLRRITFNKESFKYLLINN
jgi:beta-xylosidase